MMTVMEWTVVGLGNPGKEYEGTRHNVGRDILVALARKEGIRTWKEEQKPHMQSARGTMYTKTVRLVLPDTYMNNSGAAVKAWIRAQKDLEKLVVIQDDLDLPLGKIKLSYDSGAGGHKGIASIQRALKTNAFTRIRVGISPITPSGKLKKPSGEQVITFVLGTFRPTEQELLKKTRRLIEKALTLLVTEGRAQAMTEVNAG